MFPFGFGLSYTMFEMKCCSINMEESKIRAEVQVTNTGNEYAGKEVVQIYVTLPQTELEKSIRDWQVLQNQTSEAGRNTNTYC